ncbi:hypothetical protein FXO37_11480 [Capsicum annuum]|nr:hypothetical protein FXO37_11480 [Capsicum annuum]
MRPSREKANLLPPGLVSNLQDVLSNRKGKDPDSSNNEDGSNELISVSNDDDTRPVVMDTNADEVEFPGLTYLVHALVTQELYNIHVCAPQPWVFFHASLSISLLLIRVSLNRLHVFILDEETNLGFLEYGCIT